ncbi:hypothetical protein NHF46_11715 [Arthrobacter alpinus]|nr:hypothetical protein [Arthrobacter alpinus]
MNATTPTPHTPALLLHGLAAELHRTIDEFNSGFISGQDLYLTSKHLTASNAPLDNDPYCLHLQGIIADILGHAQAAIIAYTEAAIQLSLIEDTTREADAYTALARLHHRSNNLPAAIQAAQNAGILHLHHGNINGHCVHTLYTYALTTAMHDPEFLTTPHARTILHTISRTVYEAPDRYTHQPQTLAS